MFPQPSDKDFINSITDFLLSIIRNKFNSENEMQPFLKEEKQKMEKKSDLELYGIILFNHLDDWSLERNFISKIYKFVSHYVQSMFLFYSL